MPQYVIIRGDHLPTGETDHVRIIHSGLEGEKEYDLVVSGRGLWLRFVGRRRIELPHRLSLVQLMELDLDRREREQPRDE